MKKVKVGDKLELRQYKPFGSSVHEKFYKATVEKVTGVAVQVKYRNKYGSHSVWLNKDLEDRTGYMFWRSAKKIK